jgi:hypothetical protein
MALSLASSGTGAAVVALIFVGCDFCFFVVFFRFLHSSACFLQVRCTRQMSSQYA